jgi:large subunit ribosomal protein L21
MYAVIETGGKQYRVEVGTELEVELLDAEPGKTVTLDRVLLIADGDEASIGQPLVDGAAVSAEVLRQIRGEKLIVFKYRPKARSRVKKGHRQELTVLRINDITFGGKSAAESDAKTERQRLEEAAAAQAAKDAELAAKLAAPAKKAAAPKAKAAPKAGAKAEATTAEATAAEKPAKAAPKKATTKAKADTAESEAPAETTAETNEKPAKKPAAKPRATKKDE